MEYYVEKFLPTIFADKNHIFFISSTEKIESVQEFKIKFFG